MSHHMFSQESPFQKEGMAYWPYSNGHSPQCNCEAMRLYNAEQERRRAWDESVAAERERQIAKGFDRAHDEEHGIGHVLTWAAEYGRRGEFVKSHALIEAARELLNGSTADEALAAIARSLYNRHITWWDTYDEIDGVLRSVGLGPSEPVAPTACSCTCHTIGASHVVACCSRSGQLLTPSPSGSEVDS